MTITAIGRHADGGSLYLSIRPDGSRKWVFLYRQRGTSRLREMGLGPAAGANRAGISLADARRKAATARSLLYDGLDPLTEKRNAKAVIGTLTFGEFADQLLDDIELGFRNEKHRAQWRSTLQTYAAPLRPLHLAQIRTDDVLNVLKPIWTTKQETASRVRGRIERVLDAAKARGLRTGENPARWRGHLSELLAKPDKLKKSNFAAIPFADMPTFMMKLRSRESLSALALDFTILCATRTNETLGATWVEFDLLSKVWIIPAYRMKAEKEHRVPLSDQALEIIRSVKVTHGLNSFVFPGLKDNTSLSDMAMLECLRGIAGKGSTVQPGDGGPS